MTPRWDREAAINCAHAFAGDEVERCLHCCRTADEIAADLDLAVKVRAMLESRQKPEWR